MEVSLGTSINLFVIKFGCNCTDGSRINQKRFSVMGPIAGGFTGLLSQKRSDSLERHETLTQQSLVFYQWGFGVNIWSTTVSGILHGSGARANLKESD